MQLLDVVHSAQNLYLVFEFLDRDLKKFMDDHAAARRLEGFTDPALGLPEPLVQSYLKWVSCCSQLLSAIVSYSQLI